MERKVLQGGISTIRCDRPLFPISIYHSLDGIVEVFKMLMEKLEDYELFEFTLFSKSVNYTD